MKPLNGNFVATIELTSQNGIVILIQRARTHTHTFEYEK